MWNWITKLIKWYSEHQEEVKSGAKLAKDILDKKDK